MSEHYSDIADEADRIFTAINDKRILLIRQEATKIVTGNPSGECWYCGESVGVERRWCSRECAAEWEKEQ